MEASDQDDVAGSAQTAALPSSMAHIAAEGASAPADEPKGSSEVISTWRRKFFVDENFPEWTKSSVGITTPLMLPEKAQTDARQDPPPLRSIPADRLVKCLLCDGAGFQLPSEAQGLETHLLASHRFAIGKLELVADLAAYVDYWGAKFRRTGLANNPEVGFCSEVPLSRLDRFVKGGRTRTSTQAGQNDLPATVKVLGERVAEDKELRKELQMRRLEEALKAQEIERKSGMILQSGGKPRSCLFCRTASFGAGPPSRLLNHLAFDHNFNLGHPDNLVYVGEFLDVIEAKLEGLICIFCEKTFKSREVMKEHMRKKNHRRINPHNPDYDRFYMVNYLEYGALWRNIMSEFPFEDEELPSGFDDDYDPNQADEDTEDETCSGVENDWSDWRTDLPGSVCLFCPANYSQVSDLFHHMKVVHGGFDFLGIRKSLGLSFYEQIKLINYIRRQVHIGSCIHCGQTFISDVDEVGPKSQSERHCRSDLLDHMSAKSHWRLPEDRNEWDQPQYLFPTYENDNLLYCLEEEDDEEERARAGTKQDLSEASHAIKDEVPVIAEDDGAAAALEMLKDEECRRLVAEHSKRLKKIQKH